MTLQIVVLDTNTNESEVIVEYSDLQIQVIESYSVDARNWIRSGPVNNIKDIYDYCKNQLFLAWKPIIESERNTLPTNEDDIIKMILTDFRYRSKAQQEANEAFVKKAMKDLNACGNLEDLNQLYGSYNIDMLVAAQKATIAQIYSDCQVRIQEQQAAALAAQAESAQKEAELAAAQAQLIQDQVAAAVAAALKNAQQVQN